MTEQTDRSDDIEGSKAPLLEHLIEFRTRLMVSIAAWLAACMLAFLFVEPIYGFLVQPLAESFGEGSSRRLIYTSLPETFFTYMKLSIFAGFFLAFPVIAWQLYAFIAPGLYKKERWVLLPYLIVSPLLFFAGAALAYYQVFPLAWQFFISFESSAEAMPMAIELEAKVADYLSLVMQVLIAFGFAFQLPVVLTLLARAGMVTSAGLARTRKYALVGVVAAAAVLTPPDVISQIALAIPLYLLYELSIFSCKLVEKKAEPAPH